MSHWTNLTCLVFFLKEITELFFLKGAVPFYIATFLHLTLTSDDQDNTTADSGLEQKPDCSIPKVEGQGHALSDG
jgi:hypothetical protein